MPRATERGHAHCDLRPMGRWPLKQQTLAVGQWSGIVSGTVPGKGGAAQSVSIQVATRSCCQPCCAAADLWQCREHVSAAASRLIEDLKANARGLVDGSVNYLLSVPVIHCGNCIATIEGTVAKLDGVRDVRANLTMRQVSVTLDG